jgi:hypothetical protein
MKLAVALDRFSVLKANRGDRMQLFRKQAIDHQNRLHGEIFLVPPLRWQAIGGLLFASIIGCGALLALGSHSSTIKAEAVLYTAHSGRPDAVQAKEPRTDALPSSWEALMRVPLARAHNVMLGQAVTLSVTGYPAGEFGTLSGTVSRMGEIVAHPSAPYRIVSVQIIPQAAPGFQTQPHLQEGLSAHALITSGREPLWRWLFKPLLPEAKR